MTVSKLEKEINPLPWVFGTIIGGVLIIGTMTYAILNRPNSSARLSNYTVPVTAETLTVEIQASGTVEPIQSVNISPKNPGRLAKLLVDQGVVVKAGQPIAVMENQELYAQGAQAEAQFVEAQATYKEAEAKIQRDLKVLSAQLAQAVANLEETKRRRETEIEQTRARLAESQSKLQLAKTKLERNKSLLREGAISQNEYDELANQYFIAQANIQEVIQQLNELKSTAEPEIKGLEAAAGEIKISLEERKITGKAELERLQANIKAAEANLEIAKIQFKDTFIRAPFAGIVTQKYATEGAFVTPTTSASTTASATSTSIIALARGLEVVAKVPEIDLAQIRLGQSVEIVADAFPDLTFKGIVKSIAPEAIIEQNVTSFEVKIGILTGQDQLLSKMNVEVTFLGQQRSNVLVLPTVAIVTQEGKTGVMIPDENNQPKFHPVTIGTSVEDKTEILSGLTVGDRVFIDLPKK
jgi:HlyD family secretion protein